MGFMKASAQLREYGRITIPASVREQLGLDYGDFVVIDVTPVEERDE